ncbi:hypothetical protein [Endozoicomonas acroporae]|uniref:hypothetical protein n=1 Tax=Endozoicomonas acroporae TaxID=1701104 RepID=UPI003D7BD024
MPDKEKLLALYLLTHPTGDMTGVIRILPETIMGELKWSLEEVHETLSELFQKGFLTVKKDSQWIVINNFLKFNAPENPNQIKAIIKLLARIPKNIAGFDKPLSYLLGAVNALNNKDEKLKQQFNELLADYEQEQEALAEGSETLSEPFENPFKTSSSNSSSKYNSNSNSKDPCRVDTRPHEDEQTGEVILSGEQLPEETNPKARASSQQKQARAIDDIFQYWQTIMDHPNARLDDKRRKLIRNALKTGYAVNDLKTAILGCSYTPHNMGDNDRGQRYDGLHVIFRNADQIDRFIHNAMNQESMDANREIHQRGKNGLSFLDNDLSGTPDELWDKC